VNFTHRWAQQSWQACLQGRRQKMSQKRIVKSCSPRNSINSQKYDALGLLHVVVTFCNAWMVIQRNFEINHNYISYFSRHLFQNSQFQIESFGCNQQESGVETLHGALWIDDKKRHNFFCFWLFLQFRIEQWYRWVI
jgi:hypothetical protein